MKRLILFSILLVVVSCQSASKMASFKSYPYPPRSQSEFELGHAPSDSEDDLFLKSAPHDVDAKQELLAIPELKSREGGSEELLFGAVSKTDEWRPAESLLQLRSQLKEVAPNRSRGHDGMVGDARHKARTSDHNPWIQDGNYGVVSAYDITHDPLNGCDVGKLVQSLLAPPQDPRLKYIIWRGKIYNRDRIGNAVPWQPRDYEGSNRHDKHVHVSVLPSKSLYDSKRPWRITTK